MRCAWFRLHAIDDSIFQVFYQEHGKIMTNLSNTEGFVAFVLIFIISCVHVRFVSKLFTFFSIFVHFTDATFSSSHHRRIRVLKPFAESQRFGASSVVYKASVIGIRLCEVVGVSTIALALFILFR